MKKLYSLLKTFLIYSSTPLRIFLVLLLIIIGIIILKKTNNESNIITIINITFKLIMFLMSLKIIISNEDYVKYMNYLYSENKFICIFNHTTLIDGPLLFSVFPRMGIVLSNRKEFDYISFNEKAINKMGCIPLINNKKNGVTNIIKNKLNNRKIGDPIIFIAPCTGLPPDNPGNISNFKKNGAFVNKSKILPIIIKYEDDTLNYNFNYKESIINAYIKLFLVENYKIKIKVGDMIYPNDNESIEEYKNRVYKLMNEQYKEIKI